MVRRTFNLGYGEVGPENSANLSNGETFTAKKITNMYWNKYLRIRPSTKQIGEIPLVEGDKILTPYVCVIRKWLLVPALHANKTVSLYIQENLSVEPLKPRLMIGLLAVPTVVSLGALVASRISYCEIETSNLDAATNAVTGVSAILIFGLDKIYFIDDAKTTKVFHVKSAGSSREFPNPIDGLVFQARLFLLGQGVDLQTGAVNAGNYQDLFGSNVKGKLDDFTYSSATTDLDTSAFNFDIIKEIDEKYYGLTTHMAKIVINTSKGVEVCSSGSNDDELISSVSASHMRVGHVSCTVSPSIMYDSVLIYPSVHGIRQQLPMGILQDSHGIYDQRCGIFIFITPQALVADPVKACVMAIMDDGSVKSLYWSGEPGQLLSTTTYYDSDYRPCLEVARTSTAIYDVLILRSNDGTQALIAQETNEISCRDLISTWAPTVAISGVSGKRFTATFTGIHSAAGMVGFWYQSTTNTWQYAIRTSENGTEYMVTSTTPTDFAPAAGTFLVVPHTNNLWGQVPNTPNKYRDTATATEGVRIDLTTTDSEGNVIHRILSVSSPLWLNDRKTFIGSVNIEFSYKFKDPDIEWYSGASHYGAPKQTGSYVVLVSKGIGEHFDVLREGAGLTKMSSENAEYYTYRFANVTSTSDNITKLSFRNQSAAQEASILQLFPLVD